MLSISKHQVASLTLSIPPLVASYAERHIHRRTTAPRAIATTPPGECKSQARLRRTAQRFSRGNGTRGQPIYCWAELRIYPPETGCVWIRTLHSLPVVGKQPSEAKSAS